MESIQLWDQLVTALSDPHEGGDDATTLPAAVSEGEPATSDSTKSE